MKNTSIEVGKVLLRDIIHKLMKKLNFTLHMDAFIHSDQGSYYLWCIEEKL